MTAHGESALTFVDAAIRGEDGLLQVTTLRVEGAHIASVGERPRPGDRVVELGGDLLLPGLVNAHDHLQLNGFPPLDGARRYRNVREWIADVQAVRQRDPGFRAVERIPREVRYLHGALKNVLAGVTTVAHHDPLHWVLTGTAFPVRVVQRYGWSHSLALDGEVGLHAAFRRTPREWPWIVHAAEGVDEEAAGEFDRLHALGCIASNTVLVHAVALGTRQYERLKAAGAAVVWCPSSNLRLFGATADYAAYGVDGRVALGSDSRLSGERDLLDELRVACAHASLDAAQAESLATSAGARVLRLADRGELRPGSLADLVVLPRDRPAGKARRRDVRLVLVGGRLRCADRDLAAAAAPAATWVPTQLDGAPHVLDRALAEALVRTGVREDGLELALASGRAA